MMKFSLATLALLFSAPVVTQAAIETGKDCKPCDDGTMSECTLKAKVNLFASQTGEWQDKKKVYSSGVGLVNMLLP